MIDPYTKPDPILQSQLNKSRVDKFLLVLNLPPILRKLDMTGLRNNDYLQRDALQFSVYGTLIPTVEVREQIAEYGGQSYKVSSHSRDPYPNIIVNFTIDNRFNNYWVLYKWLALLNDPEYSLYDSKETLSTKKLAPSEYQTDFTVYAKDEFDQNIVKFTYTKAFPVSLGDITYNYREENEIETTFEFAFSQFSVDLV